MIHIFPIDLAFINNSGAPNMTKKCKICRVLPNPSSDRSFHMFPKNISIRQKWIEALNLTETDVNFKTAYVCSDHFDESSFVPFYQSKKRKRLHLESIPNAIDESAICNNDVTKEEDPNMLVDAKIDCEKIYILDNCDVKTEVGEDLPTQTCAMEDCSNNWKTETVNSRILHSNSTADLKTRKHYLRDIKPRKKVRFMTGFKTEHICREDFVSEEAWHRFLRYAVYQKRKTSAAYSRNAKKQRKIKKLNKLIRTLEGKKECNAPEGL